MSEAADLEREVADLEDADLQKRFTALFDDGQGENARRAFVSYCRNRSYHPAEMHVLCGQNMFKRLRDMLKKQEDLLAEYRATNKFLFEEAKKFNDGKIILPKVVVLRRQAQFDKLIREKFGASKEARKTACQVLNLSGREFSKIAAGTGLTDGFIEYLESLPDYVPPAKKAKTKGIKDECFAKLDMMLVRIKKPRKNSRIRSDMSAEELKKIGELAAQIAGLPASKNWISVLSHILDYSDWHLQQIVKGHDNRFINAETARYLRLVYNRLRHSDEGFRPSISSRSPG